MENLFTTYLKRAWVFLKPWIGSIALILLLHYTGLLSGISYVTGRALMYTGIMDASAREPAVLRKFDYGFNIRDLNGNIRSANDFRNKTLFLNIWATWCAPCRMEMPSIQSLYNQIDTTQIVFIMLSVDKPGDLDKVKTYIREKEFTFPVYTPSGSLPSLLQVNSIPTTLVIAPDGRVVSSETGATNYDTGKFKKFLNSLAR